LKPPSKNKLIEYTLAVIISGFFLWFGLKAINIAKQGDVGTGKIIPVTSPDESNRIVHPEGFSMISPPGWEITTGESQMILGVSRPSSHKYSSFTIYKSPIKHDSKSLDDYDELPKGVSEIEFNDHPAYWFHIPKDGVYSASLLFKENGFQWEISSYYRGDNTEELPEIFWDYLRTFRSDPVEKNKTETHP